MLLIHVQLIICRIIMTIVAKSAHSENMCIVVVLFQLKTIAQDFTTLCTWGFFSVHYVFFQPPFR